MTEFFGKTMIEHTYAAAAGSKLLSKVVVASDSERVLRVIQGVGGDTVLTGACNTGTDRIVQALHLMGSEELNEYDVVVNIQGDEPGVNPRHIDMCVKALRGAGPDSVMSTLATPIFDEREARSQDSVKCVADRNRCVDSMIGNCVRKSITCLWGWHAQQRALLLASNDPAFQDRHILS